MVTDQNPYQAYTDGSIFSDNPINLIIALYQGALDATSQAESAVRAGDIPTRTRAINKAVSILTELLVSLDFDKGGEIASNLKRLYSYMQVQLLDAHARQRPEPIAEVSKLLNTLLDGWRAAGKAQVEIPGRASGIAEHAAVKETRETYVDTPMYGGYIDESLSAQAGTAYSF